MSKPYRIQAVRADKKTVRGKQWHIRIKGGNGKKVTTGETKPSKTHTLQTATAMISAITSGNFVFEKWDDRKKKFVIITNAIFRLNDEAKDAKIRQLSAELDELRADLIASRAAALSSRK